MIEKDIGYRGSHEDELKNKGGRQDFVACAKNGVREARFVAASGSGAN